MILWTLFVIRLRLSLPFAVILSLYSILQLLQITRIFLENPTQNGFEIFNLVTTSLGISVIDIAIYLVVVQMRQLKAKLKCQSHEEWRRWARGIKVEQVVIITLSVVTALVRVEIDIRRSSNNESK